MSHSGNDLLKSLEAQLCRGLDNQEIAKELRYFPVAEFNGAMALILERECRSDLTPEEAEAHRALRQRVRRIRDIVNPSTPSQA